MRKQLYFNVQQVRNFSANALAIFNKTPIYVFIQAISIAPLQVHYTSGLYRWNWRRTLFV